ncbi:MAG: cytochrome c-type biogenesis protein CcmE [Flavobacteriales bacterium]|jgi:cytochrome c-type biogenesis protein CcmE
MHPIRRQRLITVLFIVFGSAVVIGLVSFVLSENLNLFYPPSKIVSGEAPVGVKIKAGGCVVVGSIVKSTTDLGIRFDVTDGISTITVDYTGFLPDLFDEGEAAVLDGQVDENGIFQATKVLAKHDENYTPVEVSDSINTQQAQEGADHVKTCKGMDYGS